MKKVLLIAFHYPPLAGSSGLQRALKFSAYLGENGWRPYVLTARESVYESTRPETKDNIPPDVTVVRAVAFDAKKSFSLKGRYPGMLARPDRWCSWAIDAVRRGKALLNSERIDAIWSTFPIATAHTIGLKLAAVSGLPWIADLRDSMSEPGYPADPATFKSVRKLEGRIVASANAVTFTAPGAIEMYKNRYPEVSPQKYVLLENGFDEESFAGLRSSHDVDGTGPVVLVHSGIVYPSERDPRPFFDALKSLKEARQIDAERLRIVLRATGHDAVYEGEIAQRGIGDIVSLAPALPYRDALQEMMNADGLLIFQAANCNHQIPAKVYEYFRAGRPIVALTDPQGDTARLLVQNGHELIARLDDVDEIKTALTRAVNGFRTTESKGRMGIDHYSRRRQTRQLADLLGSLTER